MTVLAPRSPFGDHQRLDQDPSWAALGARLRQALVRGDADALRQCMAPPERFGWHQGRTQQGYIDYEVNEFTVKAARFGLMEHGPVAIVRWSHGRAVSFMFTNAQGRLLFENWFETVETSEGPKLAGNQAWAVWQSKLRFTRLMQGSTIVEEQVGRAINIKPVDGSEVINAVLLDRHASNAHLVEFDLDDVYGGRFLGCHFDRENDDRATVWTRARVLQRAPDGRQRFRTLEGDARGADHPFFLPDQYPSLENHEGRFALRFDPRGHPSVVSAVGPAGTFDLKWKYPEHGVLELPGPPQEMVVSDHLGHDWSVRWPTALNHGRVVEAHG